MREPKNTEHIEDDDFCECFKCRIKSVGFATIPYGTRDKKIRAPKG